MATKSMREREKEKPVKKTIFLTLTCLSLRQECGTVWGASRTFCLEFEFLADLTVDSFSVQRQVDETGLRVEFRAK